MTVDEKNIVWLDLFPFLTYHKKVKILESFKAGEDIRSKFRSNPILNTILAEEEYNKMCALLDPSYLDNAIQKFTRDNIIIVTKYDPRYPELLKEIPNAPLCLYCKGNIQLLNTFSIGVVGTRHPSEYGIVVTKQYVKAMCDSDVTIVSGLASGVDTIAHRTALENNGKTIAVLAGGLYHIYPAFNINLAKQMTENNLILSENSPDTTPQSYLFPIRNRIIAGLSRGVLITEAGQKSGSLHTANYANDYNRDVFAVPGRINSPMSSGTNQLIKELSAHITTSPDDIINSFQLNTKKSEDNSAIQLDIREQSILNYIRTEKKTFQELADYTGIKASELNAIMLELEMNGLVTKLANNSYIMS